MTAPRFFITGRLVPVLAESGGPALLTEGAHVAVPLKDADLHHATSVARIHTGELISVVDADGVVWSVEVTEVAPTGLRGTIRGRSAPNVRPRVALFQGIAKGPKMDRVVEQAVELGVDTIVPVITERTVVRLDPVKAVERGARWRRVAEAAAKQSRAPSVARVADPVPLESVLELLASQDAVLVPWEEAPVNASIRNALAARGLPADARVAVVIGPEGGLSAAEVARIAEFGGIACSLGTTILRTETAALVAVALVMDALGQGNGSG